MLTIKSDEDEVANPDEFSIEDTNVLRIIL
jgi:hypothetical protein